MNTTESKQQNSLTNQQMKAIHLYLEMVADALDREGHTMQDVVREIKRAEIRPTKDALKEVVWKPIAKILFNVDSTTKLTTGQVDRVYEVMNKWLGDSFELHVEFPSVDSDVDKSEY